MADPAFLVKRLALQDARQAASVVQKAQEYVRLSTAKLGQGGLGQGELCKGAACVELACMALGVAVDAALVAKLSGVKGSVYLSTKAALQKVLGVGTRATARDLCIQFGCAKHDAGVRACLAAFKARYVRSLPPAQQAHVDFGRAVFLAAAFYLVARKNKVQVDRMKLLGPLGVTATEFAQVCASMSDLCHDLVGTEPRKRRAEEVPEAHRALVDRSAGAADDDGVASDSGDEVDDPNMPGGRRVNPKKQRQREYEEWKAKMLADKHKQAGKQAAAAAAAGGGGKKEKLTEKKLRQAVLSFAAGGGGSGAGGPAAAEQQQQEPRQQEEQQEEEEQQQQQQASGAPKQASGGSSKGSKAGTGGKSGSPAVAAKKAALASKNG